MKVNFNVIGIVRALYHNPEIIVDEATAALDNTLSASLCNPSKP